MALGSKAAVEALEGGDPRPALDYAIQHHPTELQVIRLDDVKITVKRSPGGRRGIVAITLPDENIVNLNGPRDDRDLFAIVRVPNHVLKDMRGPVIFLARG